jgi:hypothetical protein
MFKDWNNVGKIKAIVLALCALPNLVFPMGATGSGDMFQILLAFIFGCAVIPLITKFNLGFFKREIRKPAWNDNPLSFKRPLSFFDFAGYFFVIVGFSMILGTAIRFHTLSFIGVTVISYGLGAFVGIWLSLKWMKPKEKNRII